MAVWDGDLMGHFQNIFLIEIKWGMCRLSNVSGMSE